MCIVHSTVLNYAKIIPKKKDQWKRSVAKRLIVKVGNWFLVHLFVQPKTTDAKLFSIRNLGWFSIKVQSSLSTTPIQLQNHNFHWMKEAKIHALLNSIEYVLEKIPFISLLLKKYASVWLPSFESPPSEECLQSITTESTMHWDASSLACQQDKTTTDIIVLQ